MLGRRLLPEDKPALPAPPGVVPNLHDHDGLVWENTIAQCFCLGIAGSLLLLRCFSRLFPKRGKGRREWVDEDWMLCLAFVGLVAYSAICTVVVKNKGGVHQYNLTVKDYETIFYYFWIETIIYGVAILATKCAILLMYIHIFVPNRRSGSNTLWWVIWIVIGASISFYLAITIAKILWCNPTHGAWRKNIKIERRLDLPTLLNASGCFNTISDIFILLIPVKPVMKLKLHLTKRCQILAIFTVGATGPVFSAIGFIKRVKNGSNVDQSFHQPMLLLWAMAEMTTGIICACLPRVPALFQRPSRPIRPGSSSSGMPIVPSPRSSRPYPRGELFVPFHGEALRLDFGSPESRGHVSARVSSSTESKTRYTNNIDEIVPLRRLGLDGKELVSITKPPVAKQL